MSAASHAQDQWHSVDGPGVTVEVPGDVDMAAGQTVEGSAVTLSGAGMTVILDRSAFADSLSEYSTQADFHRQGEQIAGREADVISFRAHDGTRVVGTRLDELTAVVQLEPGQPDAVALRVLKSIRPIPKEQR